MRFALDAFINRKRVVPLWYLLLALWRSLYRIHPERLGAFVRD